MRDGNAPNMARWLAEGTHDAHRMGARPLLADRRQPGRHPARLERGHPGLPLGREGDGDADDVLGARPTAPRSSAATRPGSGLLANGGASRGNLLSGEADHVILTVSRIEAEKKANPGYRAFLANGFNVTRALVLFFWEVDPRDHGLGRAQRRRDVQPARPPRRPLPVHARRDVRRRPRPDRLRRPHGHDEGAPRDLRDLLELRRGRPPLRPRARRHARGAAQARRAVRAHRARRAATRRGPTRSSSSPTTARRRARPSSSATATALDDLVERSLATRQRRRDAPAATSRTRWSATRSARRPGARRSKKRAKNDVSGESVVVLGSGNLGLVYLMEEPRRLTLEEIERAPPGADPRAAHRTRTSAGCSSARPSTAPVALGGNGAHYLADGRVEGEDPLAAFSPNAAAAPPAHGRLRPRRGHHGRELLRPRARGGLRLRGADLLPRRHRRAADAAVHPPPRRACSVPDGEIVGAAAVHGILLGWRNDLNDRRS